MRILILVTSAGEDWYSAVLGIGWGGSNGWRRPIPTHRAAVQPIRAIQMVTVRPAGELGLGGCGPATEKKLVGSRVQF